MADLLTLSLRPWLGKASRWMDRWMNGWVGEGQRRVEIFMAKLLLWLLYFTYCLVYVRLENFLKRTR